MKEPLVAIEGFFYTKAGRQENEDVILAKKVLLSKFDKPENWALISAEEGLKLQAEIQARLEAEALAESERLIAEQDATR